MNRFLTAAVAIAAAASASTSHSQTYFFIGPSGGSFFDAANWNTATDATGTSPDPLDLPDSTSGAIGLDLVIDGTSVEAPGQVDFGAGSLELVSGATLEITGGGNDIDFNSASTLTLTDSTLEANGDVVLEGSINITDSIVNALTDDVEFQELAILDIVNSSFSSGDNLFFDAFSGSIVGGSMTSADRFGLRQSTATVLTDVDVDVQGGLGDVDDAFDAAGAGSSLTLKGTSTLLADTVEEGVDLILEDDSTATLGGNGVEILDNGSLLTMTSTSATLVVNEITNDPREFIINGLTGLSYLADPSGFTVSNWNGLDEVTLQIVVPEPTSALLLLTTLAALPRGSRRHR